MPAYLPEINFHFVQELKRLMTCFFYIITFDTIHKKLDPEIEKEFKRIFGTSMGCCDEVLVSTWKEHWKYITYVLGKK